MLFVDRLLQRWRESMAKPWIPENARVLDIGCHQGEFLKRLGGRIRDSVGLDPLARPEKDNNFEIIAQAFSEPLQFAENTFDSIVMLATLEHIVNKQPLARECMRLLRPGGRVIITVPSPKVDAIVHSLVRLKLADGMSLEEHHGFHPNQTREIFVASGFQCEVHRRFQCRLNHLYVFCKPNTSIAS